MPDPKGHLPSGQQGRRPSREEAKPPSTTALLMPLQLRPQPFPPALRPALKPRLRTLTVPWQGPLLPVPSCPRQPGVGGEM